MAVSRENQNIFRLDVLVKVPCVMYSFQLSDLINILDITEIKVSYKLDPNLN